LISTDKNLISIPALTAAFAQDYMYWVSAMPDDVVQKIVDSSFCFGLYKVQQAKNDASPTGTDAPATAAASAQAGSIEQIGFARLATDHVTFAYLTDLYVLPEYQGLGLGGWIIDCIDELLMSLPHLRWFMLRTSMPKSKEAYVKRLGMSVLDEGDVDKGPIMMGKKGRGNLV
jgi:GNAT superfamily N-acetyltransferase